MKFTRLAVPRQHYGIVAEEDGTVVGLGVVFWGALDRAWLALEITPQLRGRPFVLHRIGKALAGAGVQAFGALYALQDPAEPTAAGWLTRLGFAATGELFEGEKVWSRSLLS